MKKTYRTIDDVLHSPWTNFEPPVTRDDPTDRVLRSAKLEDSIYADLRSGDDALAQAEQDAAKKLSSFPALSRDIYQSFYWGSFTPAFIRHPAPGGSISTPALASCWAGRPLNSLSVSSLLPQRRRMPPLISIPKDC